ncbi:hypothetical protein M2101_001396 [Parabacteroides sp. PM5-20]|uniref:hypothetical protein n=1 Tax=unclassified Parabacteroides TaxID=2649774 RepID=UPI0013D8C226|nr:MULTISPECIES: hypothetical protein [unclassified Parabacteroides]MDH6534720.1 hypothetical protein [Parabacteroides sp. PM5-20]
MKTSVQKLICSLFCLLFTMTLSAQEAKQEIASYVGNWTFSAPDAPDGYQHGTASLKEAEGKLCAEFTLSGNTLKAAPFKKEKKGYSSVLYVDGYPVNILLYWEGKTLKGTAEADEMQMPITFTPVKK